MKLGLYLFIFPPLAQHLSGMNQCLLSVDLPLPQLTKLTKLTKLTSPSDIQPYPSALQPTYLKSSPTARLLSSLPLMLPGWWQLPFLSAYDELRALKTYSQLARSPSPLPPQINTLKNNNNKTKDITLLTGETEAQMG